MKNKSVLLMFSLTFDPKTSIFFILFIDTLKTQIEQHRIRRSMQGNRDLTIYRTATRRQRRENTL